MSAIYQRARPIRWDQVVGQEHVKDVLKAALEQGRVGHAYLFSGPRGVGKTTTARLIAMTANCQGGGLKPCGECESCLSVRAGNHPDVLEIDAASNNSVDDVRELREKVGLSAMRGGKKIYILDEAHMMSRAAFNALLKTLEEPPEHVIFILATTEPEKIIPTILSRCQHYRFRRLTPEEVAGKLAGIAALEGVQAEPEALQLIGRLADGAMRDGESLLERMLAAGASVTRSGVEAALGLPPGEQMRDMAGALVQGDAGGLLDGAATLYRAGYAARTVVEGLVTALGQALHAELGLDAGGTARLEGADVPRLLRLQAALDAQDSRFARGADLQSLELALTHALIAGDSVAGGVAGGTAQAASGAAPSADVTQRLARLEKELRDLKAGGLTLPQGRPAPAAASALDEIPPLDAPRPAARTAPVPVAPAGQGNWADVVKAANSQTRAFLKPARMHAQQGYVSLSYDDKSTFHAKQVVSKFDELGRLVAQVFGPVTLEVLGPTPESSRRAHVGGRAGTPADPAPQTAPAVPVAQAAAAPAPAPAPRPQPVTPPPLDDIPPFGEARGRRATSPSPVSPTPVSPAPAASAGPSLDDIPAFGAPRSSPARTVTGQPPTSPANLDAREPAPLPGPATGGNAHVADTPPLPPDAMPEPRGADATPESRVYIPPEPIFEEPDWDDLGGPFSAAPAQPATPAPAPEVRTAAAVERAPAAPPPIPMPDVPPARPRTAPGGRTDDVRPTPVQTPLGADLQDLRGHPLYQQATRLWPGRVREVGKLKLKGDADLPDADPQDADPADLLADDESA
ncbi:DNA polymerase III subunit gamma/tau [Deinococcus aquiradiocola]|nr:DNA polymerase III subunit gamma/tau [Deinococcus aquiradiocola]